MKTPERRHKICSKLTIKTPERRFTPCSTVSVVNFEHVIIGWVPSETLAHREP